MRLLYQIYFEDNTAYFTLEIAQTVIRTKQVRFCRLIENGSCFSFLSANTPSPFAILGVGVVPCLC